MTWALLNPKVRWRNEALHLQKYQWDVATSPAFATLAAGGWGSGKTVAGLGFLAISAMTSPPMTEGLAIQPTYDLMNMWLDRMLLPAFRGIMTHHDVGRQTIHLPGGRILYYRTGHVPERIQLANLTYLYLDEPHLMKRQIFEHTIARAREENVRLRILLTSLPKVGWLSEYFDGREDSEYRCIHLSTYNNRHLPAEYTSRLEAACPQHMHAAYLHGQFVPTGGSVYSMFDKERHIIPWEFRRHVRLYDGGMAEAPVNYAIDWGRRRPHVLWLQRVPPKTVMPGGWHTKRETTICLDEIYPDGRYGSLTTQRLCRKALARKPKNDFGGYGPREAVSDPAGTAKQSISDMSEFIIANNELGVPIVSIPHGERVKIGVEHVHLALDPYIGDPYLYFAQSLESNPDPCAGYGPADKNKMRSVLRAMQGYSYPEEKNDKLPDDPHHDDIFSHAADCVRYHVRYYYPEDRLAVDAWSVA